MTHPIGNSSLAPHTSTFATASGPAVRGSAANDSPESLSLIRFDTVCLDTACLDTLGLDKWDIGKQCLLALLGACFISVLAQVQIPLYPVPMTLQTLAVGLLIIKNPTRAFFSTMMYLSFISLGFPVLAGGASQALWLFRPTLGYLLAMPLGALFAIRLDKKSGWLRHLFVLAIYYYGCSLALGSLLLSVSLSITLKSAFLVGFVPFILPEAIKLFGVLSLARFWKK